MQCTLLHLSQQYQRSSDAEVSQDSPEAKIKTEVQVPHHLMLAWRKSCNCLTEMTIEWRWTGAFSQSVSQSVSKIDGVEQ